MENLIYIIKSYAQHEHKEFINWIPSNVGVKIEKERRDVWMSRRDPALVKVSSFNDPLLTSTATTNFI